MTDVGLLLLLISSLLVLAAGFYARHMTRRLNPDGPAVDPLNTPEENMRQTLETLLQQTRQSRRTLEAEEAKLEARLQQLDRLNSP